MLAIHKCKQLHVSVLFEIVEVRNQPKTCRDPISTARTAWHAKLRSRSSPVRSQNYLKPNSRCNRIALAPDQWRFFDAVAGPFFSGLKLLAVD
jgi:hypothetical protein